MKIILAALAAIIITIIACKESSKEPHKEALLEGQWKLDSLRIGKDSSIIYAMMMAGPDTAMSFEFRNDSLFSSYVSGQDTVLYQLDTTRRMLTVREGSDSVQYSVTKPSPTSLILTASDSTQLFLKK